MKIRADKTMKHNTLINALACVGLDPRRDPNDANVYWVESNDVQGHWTKNHDGSVFVAVTKENDQVKGHATINGFLMGLTKKSLRSPRKTMH